MGETVAETDPLDDRLWRHLPPEILHRVLLRLPLETLYRNRLVSKQWSALPASPPFSTTLLHSRSQHSYLLGVEQIDSLATCPLYNPATHCWSHFDLSFLSSRFERFSLERWSTYDDDRWGSSEFKGATADGGLLCVSVRIHESEQDAIFVCNPLTKACNLLPLIDNSTWGSCLGLSIHAQTYGHYTVFATKHGKVDGRFEQRLYMYNSMAATWKLCPKCPRFAHDSVSGVVCNGVYYALYEDASQDHDVLMAFDMEQEAWVDTGVVVTLRGFKKKLVVVSRGEEEEDESRLFCVSSARAGSEEELYVTVVEVDLVASVAVVVSEMERVVIPKDGVYHHRRWKAIGFRNSIVLLTRSRDPFVFDLTSEVPEWAPMNAGARAPESRVPKLLVAFTFDLRASVD